jgi:hypothetical protein
MPIFLRPEAALLRDGEPLESSTLTALQDRNADCGVLENQICQRRRSSSRIQWLDFQGSETGLREVASSGA